MAVEGILELSDANFEKDVLQSEQPVIVATELPDARVLLGDDSLDWLGGNAVCLDLALAHRRGDPFVVVDLQETGWIERYTAADRSLAPPGEDWTQSSKGYQFWTRIGAEGRFSIPKVRPGQYTLLVSGANQFEDFRRDFRIIG